MCNSLFCCLFVSVTMVHCWLVVCACACRHDGCYLGLASTVICTQQFQKIPLVPPATVAPANAVVNGNDTTFHQIHILPPPPPPPPHSHQPLLPLFTSFGYNKSPVTTPQGDTPTGPGTHPFIIIIIIMIIPITKTSSDAFFLCVCKHWSEVSKSRPWMFEKASIEVLCYASLFMCRFARAVLFFLFFLLSSPSVTEPQL